jgi:hypothetical protein
VNVPKDKVVSKKAMRLREGRLSRKYRDDLGKILATTFVVTFCAIVAYWWFVGRKYSVGDTTAIWGQFGDFLSGVVGTAVAAATLALVGVTVLIQIQAMNLAKRQLKATQRELADTRAEMRLSNAALQRQTFEATFFRLHEQFRTYTMAVGYGDQRGPDAFSQFAQWVANLVNQGEFVGTVRDQVAAAYERLYSSLEPWLGPYFRMLYHLMKLIHTSFPNDDDRRIFYASMVRAQLSKGELLIIFYNLLNDRSAGVVPYLEFYGMLKHLNRKELCASESELGIVVMEQAFRDREWRESMKVRPAPDIGP